MGKTLYLECKSGISGDMFAASLLDLGADQDVLQKVLASLPVDGFEIEIKRVKKSGLDACDFDVKLDAAHENHDHDMQYLHGHDKSHESDAHRHGEGHCSRHGHGCEHTHHHHGHDCQGHHVHRSLQEILHIIAEAEMADRAKKTAADIFGILAEAEAKAHGIPVDQVHFHEVGAVDSIVDIIAAAVCLDNLDITEVLVPELTEGTGTVRCQHGILPIPVPAVTHIVAANHMKIHVAAVEGELITPTGAAIAAAIRTGDTLPASFTIEKIGLGAGKRDYATAGILRVMLIEAK
ncbi:MAG: LarC family nickel insertion protein [Roseburia sp.]